MPTATQYPAFFDHLAQKRIDLDSDALKVALVTSAYTPSDAHAFFSDITNELATGNGYTAGGQTLASVTWAYIAANSWATARAASTAYGLGATVRPASANGYLYQAVVGGTTGASLPTYPTVVGQTVVDGGVTWVCLGRGVYQLDAADTVWAAASITARRAVIYDSTPGSAPTNPLIGYLTFDADVSSTSAAFTVQYDPTGILLLIVR